MKYTQQPAQHPKNTAGQGDGEHRPNEELSNPGPARLKTIEKNIKPLKNITRLYKRPKQEHHNIGGK